jgi:hypothetical protein
VLLPLSDMGRLSAGLSMTLPQHPIRAAAGQQPFDGPNSPSILFAVSLMLSEHPSRVVSVLVPAVLCRAQPEIQRRCLGCQKYLSYGRRG